MSKPNQISESSAKSKRLVTDLQILSKLYGWNRHRALFFILPVIFSLLAAVLEGLSVGLLVPLIKGILELNFAFLQTFPVIGPWISYVREHAEHPYILIFAGLIFIIFIASTGRFVMEYIAMRMVNHELVFFISRLRERLFNRMIHCGKYFYDRHSLGNLHDVILGSTGEIIAGLRNFHYFLTTLFMLGVYLVLILIISVQLTLLSIVLLPILHLSLTWLVTLIRKTSRTQTDLRAHLAERLSDTLMCVPLVKLYCRENEEIAAFAKLCETSSLVEYSMAKKQNLLTPLQEVMTLTALLILVSAAAFVFIKNREEVSALLVYFFMLRRTMGYFGVFNRIRVSLAQISGPLERYDRAYQDTEGQAIPEGPLEFTGLKDKIEFRGMNFGFPLNPLVLKNLNLSIEQGKVTAIVGETGAGKSTLINLIMRFYDCPADSLFMDHVDIRQFTIKSLRKHLALVSQDTILFNDTIRVNLTYGLERKVTEEELVEVVKKTRLYDFILSTPNKFDTVVGDRGVRLSGGERQRLSIARAILKNAKILIFDEATSSLDSITERMIQESIEEAIQGKTAIIIAHRLSTIKHAEKIFVLENGEIAEQGTLEELLSKKNKFYSYWQEQKFF